MAKKLQEKKKKIRASQTNWEVIKFILLFAAISVLLFSVYYLLKDTFLVSGLKSVTASITGSLLSLVGYTVSVEGRFIYMEGFNMEIIDECTAIFSSIVYSACVFAYPTNLRDKSMGVLGGVPLLYAVDIFRLFVLGIVGVNNPDMFEFVHVYFWQATFIIFVLAVFIVWLRVINRETGS